MPIGRLCHCDEDSRYHKERSSM